MPRSRRNSARKKKIKEVPAKKTPPPKRASGALYRIGLVHE